MAFVESLKKLLNNFKIYTREKTLTILKNDTDEKRCIEDNKNIIYILYEDGYDEEKDIHLNVHYKYWGSDVFNELLLKNGYEYEWYDACSVHIITAGTDI